MTDSDRQMDSGLRGLSALGPPRSVWPELEKHLDRRDRQGRRHNAVRVAIPALAASVMVAVLVMEIPEPTPAPAASRPDVSLQTTVENAVRNARPQATFSHFEVSDRHRSLDALLVSAKPRRAQAAPMAGADRDGKATEPGIDEF